jgi:hypothetical protein
MAEIDNCGKLWETATIVNPGPQMFNVHAIFYIQVVPTWQSLTISYDWEFTLIILQQQWLF